MARRDERRSANTLREAYGTSARAGDWNHCKIIAERMRGLESDGAEVMYALAYAHEKLGELDDARKAYEMVLRINPKHEKTRGRLRTLAISHPQSSG